MLKIREAILSIYGGGELGKGGKSMIEIHHGGAEGTESENNDECRMMNVPVPCISPRRVACGDLTHASFLPALDSQP